MKNLKGLNILVVDDEPGLRAYFCMKFKELGANVSEADNGVDASRMTGSQAFDCVLTDVRMPGGSGYEFLQAVAYRVGAPMVFVMTGDTDISREELLLAGAVSVFSKPMDLPKVVSEISERVTSKTRSLGS
jgi:CheY-like chemotaxis protein